MVAVFARKGTKQRVPTVHRAVCARNGSAPRGHWGLRISGAEEKGVSQTRTRRPSSTKEDRSSRDSPVCESGAEDGKAGHGLTSGSTGSPINPAPGEP